MAVKNLVVRGGADFSGMQKGLNNAQKSLNNFQKNVKSIMGKVAAVFATIKIGGAIKEGVKDAMSIESSMENINRTMQQSAKIFGDWVKSQSKAYGISLQEGYKYGSTYSNLISSFERNTKNVADNTTELMKATAVIASKTGRTFEDTAERIRSGMLGSTEAIEDLGVYTQVSMLESTKAFKEMANGKSWQQLDFQTQQQIRLMAILEQTYARYGDTLADTTQTRHNQFIASLKNVQLALGQAFLPIYNAILPALTALMNGLSKVLNIIAQFTTAIFGKPKQTQQQSNAITNQASSVADLGDSLEDAGKKAKKAKNLLAGFDELNILSQNTDDSDTGSSSGIGDIDTSLLDLDKGGFLDSVVEVNEKIQEFVDKMKGYFKNLKNFIIEHKDAIISALAGIATAFASYFILTNWSSIVGAISAAFGALGGALAAVNWPMVAVAAAIGLVVGSIVYLWRTNEDFRNSVIDIWNQIKNFISTVTQDIGNILTNLWSKYGQSLINGLVGFLKSIQTLILNCWESIVKPIIENALKMLTWLWNDHLKGLVEALGEFIMKLATGVLEIWNKFISPIVNFLVQTLGPVFVAVFSAIVDKVGTTIAVIADIMKSLLIVLGGVIDFVVGVFTLNWSKAWQGVVNIFAGIFEGIVGVVKWPLNKIIDLVNKAIRGINGMVKTINKIPGVDITAVPEIPKLAKGGVINNPTLAMIGEAGKEAVMPLENNTGWINELASKIASAQGAGNNNSSFNGDLVLEIDGSVIGKVALNQLKKMQRQGGITLIPV
ncbi:MAG: hypothetical protein HUJ77_12220 [Clostridium sp.]|uniref:phage tail protein n=1 Tax=Clostridium sp. TaxID=1506 RepID=UPI0025B96B47|nr:hypothetical protein [Clostridium sp.]MCF0149147.1 hypothetical protein [Clostridium sp.]